MKKKLMTALALVLVIAMSVAGTYAYLTSTKTVTNTFTVGSVGITLDEGKTNVDGQYVEQDGETVTDKDGAPRVYENTYKLMPGHEYAKDPTVHVVANSENSWVFVKVVNGISAFEAAGDTTIAKQIETNDWNQLKDSNNNVIAGVYYKEYAKSGTVTNYPVFSSFKIANKADEVNGWSNVGANNDVVITAYAIQKDGFNDAYTAWGEVSK